MSEAKPKRFSKDFLTPEQIHAHCKELHLTWNWWESRRAISLRIAKEHGKLAKKLTKNF